MAKNGKRKARKKPSDAGRKSIRFVDHFRHHITGKVYYARDYGYKCWPIGGKAA